MVARKPQPFTIDIDTREQLPFPFRHIQDQILPFTVERATLAEGDYGVRTPADTPKAARIALERKSLPDLYGSLGNGRDRFRREFERLAGYGYAALVIEAPWEAILSPSQYLRHDTAMSPKSVVRSLLAWSQRYGVHVFPCPNRQFAEQLTYRLLERWEVDRREGKRPEPVTVELGGNLDVVA